MLKQPARRALFLLTFIILVTAAACTSMNKNAAPLQASSSTQPATALRVGITPNAPPLIYKNGKTITGLEKALALKLGEYLKKDVTFVEVDWEKQMSFLNDGKTDIIMSGMTITQKRSVVVNFTRPYMQSGQIMLVRLEDSQRFSSGITSIMNTNHPVATVAGTVSDLFVTAEIIGANEVTFNSPQAAVDALIQKQVDAFIYDAPIVCYYAAKHQSDKLVPILEMATEEYLAWAVRKEDTTLLTEANAFLAEMQKSGALKKEIRHWIPYLYREM